MADSTITRVTGLTGTSIASYINQLQEEYFPALGDWIKNESGPLPKMLMKKRGTMGGKKSLTAVFTSNPQGVGFTAEGYDLPSPSGSTSQQPEILGKEIAARLRITFESQMAARKSSAAFSKPRTEEMRLLREELAMRITRNLYHGPYDIMGHVSSYSDTGAGTATMKARNARRYTAALFFDSGVHYFRVNQNLNRIASANGVGGSLAADHALGTTGYARIASIDSSNPASPTITFNTNPSSAEDGTSTAMGDPAANDFLVAHASRAATITGNAVTAISELHGMNGLGNINTDTTLYTALFGLLKTAASGLLATVDANSGTQRNFTERYIEFFFTKIQNISGGSPSKLMLEPFTMMEVSKENRDLRQFSPIIGAGGRKNMAHVMDDVVAPYITDWMCLPGLVWGLNPESYGYYEWFPLQSPDPNNSRFVSNKAQEEIIVMQGGNVFCSAPWKNGLADDFAFDTTAIL